MQVRALKMQSFPPKMRTFPPILRTVRNKVKERKGKVKKSKAEGRREKKTAPARRAPPTRPEKKPFGQYGHVRLSEEELKSLYQDYGQQRVEDYIRRVDEYSQQHGKVYQDAFLTLRLWMEKDGARPGNHKPRDGPEDDFLLESIRRTPKL